VQSIDPASGIGMIVIHDHSLNAQDYSWEWQQGSGPIQTSIISPDPDGVVVLPLPNTPRNADFMLTVSLSVKSPQGCADTKKMDVGISQPRIKSLRTVEIIEKYAKILPPAIDVVDPEIKKTINPKVFTDLKSLLVAADNEVNNAAGLDVINKGGFDKTIEAFGVNIRSMLPVSQVPKNELYMEIVFATIIITYSLLVLRKGDADKKDPAMDATLSTVLVSVDTLVHSGMDLLKAKVILSEFDGVEPEILGRTALQNGFDSIQNMTF
jgi:hypothetical protein